MGGTPCNIGTEMAAAQSEYYGIGKYVSDNTRTGTWGTGAIETISEQLRRELPGLRDFSPASIKKMRIFYEQWSKLINRSPMANDLQTSEKQDVLQANELLSVNRSPLANDLDWHEFMSLSFSHHYEILAKTETLEERVIENSIVSNVKNFILTFGKDFTFMGNQEHIDKFGHDHYVDLLSFNRELQSLVVFDLLCCAQHNNSIF